MELKLGDARLTTTFVAITVAGGVLTVVGGLYGGAPGASSAAVGATTALANVYVLSRIVAALAIPHEDARENARFSWGVIAVGKMMVVFGGLGVLMTRHLVDPIPLLVGYGALPIGIAIGAVVSDKTGPRPES